MVGGSSGDLSSGRYGFALVVSGWRTTFFFEAAGKLVVIVSVGFFVDVILEGHAVVDRCLWISIGWAWASRRKLLNNTSGCLIQSSSRSGCGGFETSRCLRCLSRTFL